MRRADGSEPLSGAARAAAARKLKKCGVTTVALLEAMVSAMKEVRAVERAAMTDTPLLSDGDDGVSCLPTRVAKKARLVGRGAFGEVLDIGGGRAVKLTTIRSNDWLPFGISLDLWKKEVRNATASGEMGVGPVVYDSTLCRRSGGWVGLITMQLVDNAVTLESFRKTGSPKEVEKADQLMQAKLAQLHDAGLFHQDLHSANVVVSLRPKSKRLVQDVFILDYGFTDSVADLKDRDRSEVDRLCEGRVECITQLSTRERWCCISFHPDPWDGSRKYTVRKYTQYVSTAVHI
jgi:hypothetical protein